MTRSNHQMNTPTASGVGELRQQLVGVGEQGRRGRHDGGDGDGEQPPGPAPDDAVDEHDPGAEARHLDELELVVVEPPPLDERRQQEREDPRVGDRAERAARVEHARSGCRRRPGPGRRRRCCGPGAGTGRSRRPGCGRCGAAGSAATAPMATTTVRATVQPRVAVRTSRATGCALGRSSREQRHCVLPRAWMAARRSATFSGLNIVRCHARPSRASCSQPSSSWAIAA